MICKKLSRCRHCFESPLDITKIPQIQNFHVFYTDDLFAQRDPYELIQHKDFFCLFIYSFIFYNSFLFKQENTEAEPGRYNVLFLHLL